MNVFTATKRITLVVIIIFLMSSACFAMETPWTMNQETYVVQEGDTLESIAIEYMEKNTYGTREQKEFISGIKELNPWLLSREIQTNDKIEITFWTKN